MEANSQIIGIENKRILRRDFSLYVSQSVLAMMGFSLYILADTYFVANGIGTMGLAGLNIALPIYSLILGTGMLLSVGGSTFFAVNKARGDEDTSNKIFSLVLTSSIIIGLIFLIFGRSLSEELAYFFGGDEETVPYASVYIKVVSTFSVPFMMNNIIVAFIRNDQSPRFATLAVIAGNLSNMILDWIFIYPLNMGMYGAALATGVSPIVGLAVLSIYFIKKKNSFHLGSLHGLTTIYDEREINYFKHNIWILRNVFILGLSSFIIEIAAGLTMITFNLAFWNISGNLGVSAYSIVLNIAIVITAFFNGIGQGVQPLISSAHGTGNHSGTKYIIRMGILASIFMSIFLYVILYVFATPFSDVFNKTSDPELNRLATIGIRYYFTAFFFGGLNIVIAAALNAQEKALNSLAITMSRGLIILVPAILLLSQFKTITALWFALPVAEGLTLMFILFIHYIRTNKPHSL